MIHLLLNGYYFAYNHYKPNRKVFPWAFYMIIKNVVVGLPPEHSNILVEVYTPTENLFHWILQTIPLGYHSNPIKHLGNYEVQNQGIPY